MKTKQKKLAIILLTAFLLFSWQYSNAQTIAITGPSLVCLNSTASYSVNVTVGGIYNSKKTNITKSITGDPATPVSIQWNVQGGTLYGATLLNANSINVKVESSSCTISVIVEYSDGTVKTGTKLVGGKVAPPNLGAITGSSSVAKGATGVAYSVAQLPSNWDAIYTWSTPSGATITSGQGTYKITVSFSQTAVTGLVMATPSNSCGTGETSIMVVNVTGTTALDWNTFGNQGTNPQYNFIGSIDNQDLAIRTNNIERLRITKMGNVGIGTTNASNKLEINQGLAGNSGLRFTQLTSSSTAAPGNGKFLSVNSSGDVILTDAGNLFPTWSLLGNEGTNPNTNFIGTKELTDLTFRTNNIERLRILGNGNVGIGTTNTGEFKLAVKGTIGCGELKVVAVAGWADFVFKPNYKLRTLSEIEQFVKTHQHLPEIPSEKEVNEQGISVGEMNAKLLQKIEELTLYVIDLQKQVDELKARQKK